MKISPTAYVFIDLYADFAVAKTTQRRRQEKCTGGWQYVVLVPGGVTSKSFISGTRRTSGIRPVVDEMGQNGAGGHDFIQAVYLKSPMQRLEQGDVVTVTQFPRRFHQICYNEQNLAQRLLERRDINTSRYEAMQPCRGFFKHLTSGGFSVKFSKHMHRCQSGATAHILTARKALHQPHENVFLR